MPYKDPEKERERQRRRRADPRYQEYQRGYKRDWKAVNPEKQAEYDRVYREASPDKASAKKARHRERNLDRVQAADRADKMFQVHGLRPADWARLFAEQDGRCCYCRRPLNPDGGRETAVDHDHSCSCGPRKSCDACRRGIACAACNKIIGLAYEDPGRLEAIAASLRVLAAEARERITGKPAEGELPLNVLPLERREAAG